MKIRFLSLRTPRGATTLFVAGFLILSAPVIAISKASFLVKPPPSWVRTVSAEVERKDRQPSSVSSSSILLDDRQIKVGEKTVERYYHYVQRIETSAGLDDISQLKFYFEPSYQQLIIHFIHIQRSNTTIDALKPSEVRVIQQEEELDQQLYNGTLAALIFLNDLRVGDVVDFSYTISGENPVLGGRFAETNYLAGREPIQQLFFRLIYPSKRSLSIKNVQIELQPAVSILGDDTEYVWERQSAAAVTLDDSTPSWFNPYPRVSLSEFRNWEDVVQWALPLYKLSPSSGPALSEKTEQWKREFPSPEQRTIAALRFAQDEIRYLGIELGRYSHQPTSPAKVFARRFGDCKDKSLLLSRLLVSMGIDAAPALVNSREGHSLDKWQPSPFAFDHVIVQAKINGKTYWLDPTISYQRGGLDKYYDPPYERALVLREGIRELEKIPFPASGSGSIAVQERYEDKNGQGPISLSVTTTYRGADADAIRYELSNRPLAQLGKSYLNFYANSNPSIRAEGLPEVADDQNSNRVVVKEKYLIDEFWKDDKHRFIADKIYSEVDKPAVSQRSMPLGIHFPLSISQTIEINLAEGFDIPTDQGSLTDDALSFEYNFANDRGITKVEYSLKTFADSVPIEKVQSHLLLIDKIQGLVGFELSGHSRMGIVYRSGSSRAGLDVVVGIIVLPLLVILSVLVIRGRGRKRKLEDFSREVKSKPGTSPETAIRLSAEGEIESSLRSFECRCGQYPYNPESPPKHERFTYDGERLLSVRLRCPSCGQNSDLYLNTPAEQLPGLAEAGSQ